MSFPHYSLLRDDAVTSCDEPHPMRLPRNAQPHPSDTLDRRLAILSGKRGYLCTGDEHFYPIWILFDDSDDRLSNVATFDVYADAKRERDRLNSFAALLSLLCAC